MSRMKLVMQIRNTVRAGGVRVSEGACAPTVRELTRAAREGVDEETADETADETDDGSERNRGRGLSERDTTDKNDGLHTCSHVSEMWERVGE